MRVVLTAVVSAMLALLIACSGGSGEMAGPTGAGDGGDPPSALDPAPFAVELSGLIETSGHQLVFTQQGVNEVIARQLTLLDLATGATVDLNPERKFAAFFEASPDQRTLVFSGLDGSAENNLHLVRLDERG
jgi:hypothetical protein